jgi:transposase
MARFDLSDVEWRLVKPLLPDKPRGVARVDDRRVLNGIFYVLRTGSPLRAARALRPLYDGLQSLQSMGPSRRLGSGVRPARWR